SPQELLDEIDQEPRNVVAGYLAHRDRTHPAAQSELFGTGHPHGCPCHCSRCLDPRWPVNAALRTPLRRSRSNRMIAGVVAGLAKYFGVDPTVARVLYVIGSIVSAAFPGILVYLVLWAIVPEGD